MEKSEFERLAARLKELSGKQEFLEHEIQNLRSEIIKFRPEELAQSEKQPLPAAATNTSRLVEQERRPLAPPPPLQKPATKKVRTDIEKFIGENLINKIGIAVTVIGVGVGSKYAIDHQLIDPITRIILGYIAGLILFGFAVYLKKRFDNFSAVLLSGSMAILYFITFVAYSPYGLIPRLPAFILMFFFTCFTVLASLRYNKQVIAIIGLAGAYAVPFLLNDNSGNIGGLFTYITIINAGILFLSFRKYWKPLFYISFALTWLIFFTWAVFEYDLSTQFVLGITFAFIFYITFYVTFVAYKLIRNSVFEPDQIILMFINAFAFYGAGYAMISDQTWGEPFLGLFTLGNALIHFAVSLLFRKKKIADRNAFYLVIGLVLVFITITIPVQLDGNWVTLFWAGEALLLFWIGRTKKVPWYEKLSYPLMVLAFISIAQDWITNYGSYYSEVGQFKVILNVNFLSSVLFAAAFAVIARINIKHDAGRVWPNYKNLLNGLIATLLFLALYFPLRLEIEHYWNLQIEAYNQNIENNAPYNPDFILFSNVWVINYSMLFLTLLGWLNLKKIQDRTLGYVNLVLNMLMVFSFLTVGLYALTQLRESFLEQRAPFIIHGAMNVGIRYIAYACAGLLIWSTYRSLKSSFMEFKLWQVFDLTLGFTFLWVASSELINLMDLGHSHQSDKLGLSILWGIYAALLISLGIWKQKKHLRIGAIVLFGLTLVKLFMYDLTQLDTISKTIVLVALGVLLLIISFLYNKYKHLIVAARED